MTKPPKLGIYVDDSNLFYAAKEAGWKVDHKKLLRYVRTRGELMSANYFMGMPPWEPAKTTNEALASYFGKIGYSVHTKPLKKIRDDTDPKGFKNKCNFDVEIANLINDELPDLDKVIICSGDSDFISVRDRVLARDKAFEFYTYDCA